MQPDVSIREAALNELDGLVQVVIDAYSQFTEYLPPGFVDEYREEVAGVLGNPNTQVLVAEDGGATAGTLAFYPDGRFYHESVPAEWACLRTLAVLPAYRGRGIGRALMDESVSRARALGRSQMLLHTLPFMAAARALHERVGFTRAPELDVDYSTVTALAYLLDLAEQAPAPSGR
ncbi:MAG TPA: GNAT family N-acetyltransferase [Actinomycetota bacterium]|nr:GNAT family N-acetyltransferase [Actinomycetota bacterium]